jgi:hypothetical protein
MKTRRLLPGLLGLAAAAAGAANPWPNGVPTAPPPPPPGFGVHGHFHGNGGFVIYSAPEVYYEREIIREVPVAAPAPPPPPPPPRKPYVIGRTYDTLPGKCMKLVEAGQSYFHCSGEWYREVPGGYRAVRQPG